MEKDRIIAKTLNQSVTGNKFDDKPLNDYIYSSLSQPPIRIIDRNGSDDELDFTVECPNCHKYVNYGSSIYMLNGYLYCSEECREKLLNENEYLRNKYGEVN
jgi:endogenous inhibitor of DNA gyrase (YacG/DUF329 family)